MTAWAKRTVGSLLVATLGAVAGCTSYFEIPIQTPIQPKLDTSAFQRVLVAGFIAGGSDEVDGNLETVRLIRSQLRNKSELRVIDADALPLLEVAARQEPSAAATPPADGPADSDGKSTAPAAPATPPANGNGNGDSAAGAQKAVAPVIKNEADLEPLESLFANVAYWKRIGEEYQQPLIVTGTVLFMPHARSGFVQSEQEVYDSFGRRRVVPVRTYRERKGFILRPTFIFIDGRTGETLHSETFREEVLFNADQTTPALSSYFELMDRLLPTFLNTLSTQKIKGTRILLK